VTQTPNHRPDLAEEVLPTHRAMRGKSTVVAGGSLLLATETISALADIMMPTCAE